MEPEAPDIQAETAEPSAKKPRLVGEVESAVSGEISPSSSVQYENVNEATDETPEVQELSDFEFVSVPRIKLEATNMIDESDPFSDVQETGGVSSLVSQTKAPVQRTVVLRIQQPTRTVQIQQPTRTLQIQKPLQIQQPIVVRQPVVVQQQLQVQKVAEKEPQIKVSGKRPVENFCLHCNKPVVDINIHLETEECFRAILKCSNCQRFFDCERNYLDHFSRCKADKIECELCKVVFSSATNFGYHWYNMHGELVPAGLDKCAHCDSFWCQMLVGTVRPKCLICCSFYASRASLMRHLHTSHLSAAHQFKKNVKKRLSCTLCFKNFDTPMDFANHMRSKKCKFVKCEICKSIFGDSSDYNHHMITCHNTPGEAPPTSDKAHRCSKCGQLPPLKKRT